MRRLEEDEEENPQQDGRSSGGGNNYFIIKFDYFYVSYCKCINIFKANVSIFMGGVSTFHEKIVNLGTP